MNFYLLLATVTIIIIMLTWLVWQRTKSISFPLGIAIIYYWSLLGAWVIVFDGLGGDSISLGFSYQYLYSKLFRIHLDQCYYYTIILYAAFIITILLCILMMAQPSKFSKKSVKALRLSHWKLLMLAVASGLLSFFFLYDQLADAISNGISGYTRTRYGEISPFYTLVSILNRMALIPGSIGLAVVFSGDRGKYIIGREKGYHVFLSYVLVLGTMYVYSLTLGNKNELLQALLMGFLFYIANSHHPNVKGLVVLGVASLVGIAAIDVFRSFPLTNLLSALRWETLLKALLVPFRSNELFGAHFSMYGAMHFHVSFTFGFSLVSLAASVVPRFLWPNRPLTIYEHYAQNVGALEGQGYSIHHATGWYLNFGVPGVLLGAVLLACIWAMCFNLLHARTQQGIVMRVFAILAPWSFVAGLPGIIRAGPEAYKGMIIDCFIFPMLVILLSCARIRFWPRKRETPVHSNHQSDAQDHAATCV